MGKNGYPIMHEIKNITITPEILKLIAEIDEFTGRWKAMQTLAPERPPPDGAPIQGLNFSLVRRAHPLASCVRRQSW
jgi:hypothetical protein